jgi:GxxExxY protein
MGEEVVVKIGICLPGVEHDPVAVEYHRLVFHSPRNLLYSGPVGQSYLAKDLHLCKLLAADPRRQFFSVGPTWPNRICNRYAIMDINDITYRINGAVFEVNKVLGPGFLEKVYENALFIELKRRGLKVERQVPIKVHYKDNVVGEYSADLFVEDTVIVELKTVETLDKAHEAQLLNYLKATGIQVGILVNFKHPKAQIKRMVLNLPEGHHG